MSVANPSPYQGEARWGKSKRSEGRIGRSASTFHLMTGEQEAGRLEILPLPADFVVLSDRWR
jgi:hypothetical protein